MECIKIYHDEPEGVELREPKLDELHAADKWILSRVNTLAKDATENMDKFELGIAVQKVYDFIWDEFCDWYIEIAKFVPTRRMKTLSQQMLHSGRLRRYL